MSVPINPALNDFPVYQPGRPIEEVARELGIPAAGIIKLASNENPLGPSPAALAAMQHTIANINLYPDGNAFYLKQKLGDYLGLPAANLILGNGSNEIIEFVGHALMGPDTEVLVSQYCFAVYPLVTKLFNATLVTVPARNYGHDLSAMLRAITPRTRVIFVANPNNPTGTTVRSSELREFVRDVPHNVLVALDQAYIEFQEGPLDFLDEIRSGQQPNLLLMRTFSKIFGLAGLRIGYGIADTSLITALEKVRQPFNINSIAQAGALAALTDGEHITRTRQNNAAGLKWFERALTELKLEFIPSEANFVLVRVGDGQGVFDRMQKRGVIIRPMGGYDLPEWIRISIGTPEQNERCLNALKPSL
jgi:histidinol-phosphate aminotransferase